jgi:hypothetical protein
MPACTAQHGRERVFPKCKHRRWGAIKNQAEVKSFAINVVQEFPLPHHFENQCKIRLEK